MATGSVTHAHDPPARGVADFPLREDLAGSIKASSGSMRHSRAPSSDGPFPRGLLYHAPIQTRGHGPTPGDRPQGRAAARLSPHSRFWEQLLQQTSRCDRHSHPGRPSLGLRIRGWGCMPSVWPLPRMLACIHRSYVHAHLEGNPYAHLPSERSWSKMKGAHLETVTLPECRCCCRCVQHNQKVNTIKQTQEAKQKRHTEQPNDHTTNHTNKNSPIKTPNTTP